MKKKEKDLKTSDPHEALRIMKRLEKKRVLKGVEIPRGIVFTNNVQKWNEYNEKQ